MEIVLKKTSELTSCEMQQICDLFFEVFEKNKEITDFKKQFSNTCKGYSYHGLIIEHDNIVGCYSSIPYEYNYFGQKQLFSLSVDTMLKKEYRGNPFLLKKLSTALYQEMQKDGIVFVFGFPNENIYMIRKKILKWQDIAMLDFYVLPIKIGNIKPSLKVLNSVSSFFAYLVNSSLFVNFSKDKAHPENISKITNQTFINQRYGDDYKCYKDENRTFYYINTSFEGSKVSYLVDILPLSKKNIELAVSYIRKQHHKEIDIIMYLGNLSFTPKNLFKLPKKYHPKKVYMSGKILDKEKINTEIFSSFNWNINLSNFDVV